MSDYPNNLTARPLQHWPGPMTGRRTYSPFRASLSSTLALLTRELNAVAARDVELQVAVAPGDFRIDGRPRAHAKAAHPGVVLTFTLPSGDVRKRPERLPLSFPCDRYTTWQDNLRAIALALEALRKVDRYGVTKHGEQYRGFAELPSATGDTMDRDAAQAFIDRHGGSYREAAKRLHPDHGGDPADFRLLVRAKEVLGA